MLNEINSLINSKGLKNILIYGSRISVYKECCVILIVFYKNNQNQRVKLLNEKSSSTQWRVKNLMINGLNEWVFIKGVVLVYKNKTLQKYKELCSLIFFLSIISYPTKIQIRMQLVCTKKRAYWVFNMVLCLMIWC